MKKLSYVLLAIFCFSIIAMAAEARVERVQNRRSAAVKGVQSGAIPAPEGRLNRVEDRRGMVKKGVESGAISPEAIKENVQDKAAVAKDVVKKGVQSGKIQGRMNRVEGRRG